MKAAKILRGDSFSLLLSVSAYLSLSWLFLDSLLHPLENLDFIYGMGLLIYILEFINISSNAALRTKRTTGLYGIHPVLFLIFYSFFILALFMIAHSFWAVLYFSISLFAKIVFIKKLSHKTQTTATFILWLLTISLAFQTSNFWISRFPFPKEFLTSRPPNINGALVANPQPILFWGIIYNVLMATMEVILFFHPRKNRL